VLGLVGVGASVATSAATSKVGQQLQHTCLKVPRPEARVHALCWQQLLPAMVMPFGLAVMNPYLQKL